MNLRSHWCTACIITILGNQSARGACVVCFWPTGSFFCEGPQYDRITGLQFSSSDKHVAYIGDKDRVQYVVVDGQESEGARIENFRFSADGEHYAYVAFKDRQAAVVVDGKEGPKYSEIPSNTLTLSADGKRWAYGGSIKGKWQVTVNDEVTPVKQLSGFQAPGAIVGSPILLSPDGSRVAFVASGVKNSPYVVYVDGKPAASGGTYSRARFSDDSKHFAVVGSSGNKQAVFVDGMLGPAYPEILNLNPNSLHF